MKTECKWIMTLGNFLEENSLVCGVFDKKNEAMKVLRSNGFSYNVKENLWINKKDRLWIELFQHETNQLFL